MVHSLLGLAFRRPLLLGLLVVGTAIFGLFSYAGLPRDVFPNLAAPVFNIIVQNPAMAPEELETGVAVPIETALAGVPGVRRVRSYTQAGVAQIIVDFDPNWDYYLALAIFKVSISMELVFRDAPQEMLSAKQQALGYGWQRVVDQQAKYRR